MAQTFKCTFHFWHAKWGWNESWWWTSPTLNIAACEIDCKQYVGIRLTSMTSVAALEAVSIEGADSTFNTFKLGVGEVRYAEMGCGYGTSSAGTCNSPWLALLARVYTNDRLYSRNWYMRGLDDASLCLNPVVGPMQWTPGGGIAQSVQDLLDFVCNANKKYKSKGTWTFLANSKPLGRQAATSALDIQPDPTSGQWWIKTPAGQVAPTLGQKVHLHGFRGPGLYNANGDTVVTTPVLIPPAFTGYFQVKKRQAPAPCTVTYDGKGTYWTITRLLATPSTSVIARPVKKKTGTIHFGSEGRASRSQNAKLS